MKAWGDITIEILGDYKFTSIETVASAVVTHYGNGREPIECVITVTPSDFDQLNIEAKKMGYNDIHEVELTALVDNGIEPYTVKKPKINVRRKR